MKMLSRSMDELIALEKDARDFGFDWPNKEMIIEQAISECKEIFFAIKENEPSARVQEEIGDLIHTAISLCLFAGFDVDNTLSLVNSKFGNRMRILKALTKEQGLENLQGQSVNYMLELWRQVKLKEKNL